MPNSIDIEDLRGDLDDDELLTRAERDWNASQDFLESNVHAVWSDSIKMWQGRHLATQIAGRSQLFLRKPRNVAERIKAGLLDAFFSTGDPVSVEPARENVPDDVLGAKIRQAYLNYRLGGKPIPWFQLIYSAADDLAVHNIAIARVEWVREVDRIEYMQEEPVLNPLTGAPLVGEDGQPLMTRTPQVLEQTMREEPEIRLVRPENMRIDSRIDWTCPYSGQYIIEREYMTYQYLLDLSRIDRRINLEEVDKAARIQYDDVISVDRYQNGTPEVFDEPDRLEIEIWRYWYKVGPKWWFAWTAGNRGVVRRPEKNPYAHGKPNYVFGFHVPESHLFYSDSIIQIHKDYFTAINGIRNQRFDNVALILNKHAVVRRDANADLASLVNRRSGGVTPVDGDPRQAVHWDEVPDISASGYNEEILLDRELSEGTGIAQSVGQGLTPASDELATQSVLKQQNANKKEAVNIRIVAHTFIVPIAEMLIALADQFENDPQVLAIVGATLGYGEADDNIPNLLEIKGQYSVKVNAGLGALTPEVKLQQMDIAIQRLSATFGPIATLPLWQEYLPLLGIKNVKEVLESIRHSMMLDQLMALMTRASTRKPGANGNGKSAGANGNGARKMPGEMDAVRSIAQGGGKLTL